ncbi:VOC family protein [Zavarzinia compransoris]|uniref:Biphenyl 2,3-dioxygenase n=1 Tax=Zavarzinia compransoris TaxID=1264899 RepID=A0A317E1E8_9PROT|nr:VOC family protein [Zavarzinia compransoris]PWR19183.1 biphenyl 2,3-dioxygenase [Zavarzinia compransoris]TDP49200.1 3,4-dihydroxy-9,10-secoandrosta-1,3,5(10)-triene-9,17-dione 4,5-dioxygenase [Zavarzinia compransoris]
MYIRELGYVLVGSTDLGKWRQFATEVLGLQALETKDGDLHLKMDGRQFRFLVRPAADDGLIASGWEVQDQIAFRKMRAHLAGQGVEIADGDAEGAALRHVQEFFGFRDPAGNAHEVYWGPISDFARFQSPLGVAGFVTEGMGLGHVVLPAMMGFDETHTFWTETVGFGLSDILKISMVPGMPPMRIQFYHCNPRQHSLALAEMPSPANCIHVMIEVKDFDDVGRALDRVSQHQVPVVMGLGKHVNDEMISFYIFTPGNFALEYGWGGITKDWTDHQVFETTSTSHWGHRLGG